MRTLRLRKAEEPPPEEPPPEEKPQRREPDPPPKVDHPIYRRYTFGLGKKAGA